MLDVNQAALELYAAHDKAQFAVQQAAARMLPLAVLAELPVLLAENETQYECETAVRTFQGVDRLVMLRACFIPDRAQRLSRVLLSLVNMTERQPQEN